MGSTGTLDLSNLPLLSPSVICFDLETFFLQFVIDVELVKGSTFSTNTLNQAPSTFSTLGGGGNTGTFNVSNLGGQGLSRQPTLAGLGGKDGKSRAKSRDYLKQ